jgi:adenylate kinase
VLTVVLLGPPGSGKGTQAARLAARTGAVHISTGELLRAEVAAGSQLGRRVAERQAAGELVPDELMLELALPRARTAAAGAGYVLDGFPRSLPQARALDRQARPGRVLLLAVPTDELLERMAERAGREHRADDTPEVFRRRLAVFETAAEPLAAHYRRLGLLCEVDATGPPDDVAARIRTVLEL